MLRAWPGFVRRRGQRKKAQRPVSRLRCQRSNFSFMSSTVSL
jgi:hypothetical protein